jgi:ribosomal-protein-alanine N-acetyltransferase
VADLSHAKSVLRGLEANDFLRLHEIDRICFDPGIAYSQAELFSSLEHPDSLAKVAELGGEIVAFAVARILDELSAHIITLDVLPEARRRRIGTSLMGALHNEFRARNLAVSILEVEAGNKGALRFYRKLGYQRVELLQGYYAGVRDACRMVKCF